MARALDIARYLVHLASPSEDEDVDCLSHLRLQKLLYYVQGWHLAAYAKPLFSGRIEAWTHGPVVREVYPAFADHRCAVIPPSAGADDGALTASEKEFVRTIWDRYKKYSASALREMTHEEAPWLNARGGLRPHEKSSQEITHEALRQYFAPRVAAQLPKGISLEQLIRADEDIDQGRFVSHQALVSRLAEKGNGV